MKISVFQALTLLAQIYKKENRSLYKKIEGLYLSGVKTPEDEELLKKLLKDKALSQYTISSERSEINEDPVRRYFESQLCFETLLSTLDSLDSKLLQKHFESITELIPYNLSQDLDVIFTGSQELCDEIPINAGLMKEIMEGIRTLKNPASYQFFKPRQGNINNSPEQLLILRKEKMILLGKCFYMAMIAIKFYDTERIKYPFDDLYNQKGSVFDPINRGRKDKVDPLTGRTQDILSCNLGIMSSNMPLPRNDILLEDRPSRFVRPCEIGTFSDETNIKGIRLPQQIPDRIFATKVTPFINSVSGTMLIQLKTMAILHKQDQCVYENPESASFYLQIQLQNYFKAFISFMIFNSGGHSLYEFIATIQLPEIQKEFKKLRGFSTLTLEKLFRVGNEIAFEKAVEKTMEYNAIIIQRKRLHQEITKTTLSKKQSKTLLSQELEKNKLQTLKVFIKNGSLVNQEDAPIDTQEISSNGKKGFANFIINSQGELILFKTPINKINLSNYIDQPVRFAGEIQVKEGNVIAITDECTGYWGNLYSFHSAINLLQKSGVNLSETSLYTLEKPKALKLTQSSMYPSFHIVKASDLDYLETVFKSRINASIKTVNQSLDLQYGDSYLTTMFSIKDSLMGSDLTKRRNALMKKFCEQLARLSIQIKDASNFNEVRIHLSTLVALCATTLEKNKILNDENGKKEDQGRLVEPISIFQNRINKISTQIFDTIKPDSEMVIS